ncbi:MAG TPA: rhodanese-like domain-containing protein [Candidatus Marinimicrobia bacterium]|nr:rhodanese-like domain-containing protein [Candidatus Neomarinimicrobiota bacterium]
MIEIYILYAESQIIWFSKLENYRKQRTDSAFNFALLVRRSLIVVIAAALFALLFNHFSPRGIPLITPHRQIVAGARQTKVPIFQNRRQILASRQNVSIHAPEEIDLETAYRHFQNYSAIFVDTRSAADYRAGHIPRAVSIPLETLDYSADLLPDLPRNETLISYCDGEECAQSIDMAVLLSELGFTDVYFFFGGWDRWQSAGYPISVGDQS